MARPLPSDFHPELSDRALQLIAEKLLEVRWNTLREMTSPFDDEYTRETAVFGRQRNALLEIALTTPGMELVHAGMDLTFKIGSVPCRFFTDDPDSPQKSGFFKRNRVDSLFAVDDNEPVMWRFIVERAFSDDHEDRVFFAGFNAYYEKVSEWEYEGNRSALYSVDTEVPESVDIGPATVELKEDLDHANNKPGASKADGK